MWSPYQLFIAVGMVFTGSINTLATKLVIFILLVRAKNIKI